MDTNRQAFDQAIANMISNPKFANYLFYGHLIAQCRVVMDETLPAPAGVSFNLDHYILHINPLQQLAEDVPGFGGMPLEQRLGVLKHEMLHILNGHVARRQDRDHRAFNIATDCAINQFIDRNHLPEGVIYPDTFPFGPVPEKLTAEQYYEHILKYGDGDGNNDNGNGSGSPLDDHSKWQESTGDKDLQTDLTKNMIDRAVNDTQKTRGTVPSQISDWLDLFTHKRELDWRKVLRNIVGNKRVGTKKTILRPDRRLPNSEWIKGRTKDRLFDLLVISDVSGSVDDAALLSLWGEVRHICSLTQSSVKLIQVDTSPSLPEDLTKNTKTIERKACGGTNLHPALDMAKKHRISYNALVVTTDGYLDSHDVLKFADLNKRVIWLIEKSGKIMPEMSLGRMQAFQLKT